MLNFGLTGAGGYIAPRHIEAIYETGNELSAAYDPFDSVGRLDKYTRSVSYYKSFEEFAFHCKYGQNQIDFLSVCSPNYMHKYHIAFGLEIGANVICEKPLVIDEHEIDVISELEAKHPGTVNTILQLRVHPSILKLKSGIGSMDASKKHEVELCYITSRGPWYHQTWKANDKLSGGLASNIGVHFFDMLTWIFGGVEKQELHISKHNICAGFLELERARVKWVLSIDSNYLPSSAKKAQKTTYRSITVDGKEVEFSGGFTDLHKTLYKNIISGEGFGIEESRTAIKCVCELRSLIPTGMNQNSHDHIRTFNS